MLFLIYIYVIFMLYLCYMYAIFVILMLYSLHVCYVYVIDEKLTHRHCPTVLRAYLTRLTRQDVTILHSSILL